MNIYFRMISISILLGAIFLLVSCSEAPRIEEKPTGRIVLAEFFTYARCSYCPEAEHALDSLFNEYSDSLAVIAYHRRIVGDTLSPEYVAVRESLYQITSSPTVVFDGDTLVQTKDPSQNYSAYENCIVIERNIKPKLRLHLEKNIISSSVNIKLSIVSIDSIESSEYRLFFVLYEDSVYFTQSGAPESTYYFVMRKMIPDEQGVPIDLFYPDSSVKEVDFNLQSNWNHEKLGIVAFIQDMENKNVMQAIVDKRIKTAY